MRIFFADALLIVCFDADKRICQLKQTKNGNIFSKFQVNGKKKIKK